MFLVPEIIKNTVLILSIVQCTYAACIILLGDTLYEQFEDGVVYNPKNIFSKTWNFVIFVLLGIGPYIYRRKALHLNWFVKRAVMAWWVLLMIIGTVMINFLIFSITSLLQ
ncbi:hypothetical protein J9317_18660 [Metabacillus sp. KIGAM252]|uniref:DUF5658 domain-containing protein n=1 Tax=Metabacillus flavus TaxID=2823519 RepID=A0ABS5LJF4_9BACI|nr:hypothetical protein [Metabacillus flavus]MBS2970769.1 hypothetical protein [Metabacillus flavus]